MKLVLIQWRDITNWNGWNAELIEAGLDEPITFYTVGFLLRKDKRKVTISDTYPEVGAVTTFPRGCIDRIEILDGKKFIKGNSTAGE